MIHFALMTDEERFARLERKATEIRKMLFGALLLAKDVWKGELSRGGEGLEIMEAMEKAEESFTEGFQPDARKRLEHTLDVINQRAKSIFDLMSYISKYGKHD
jgi:hypothetical protein